MSRIYKEWHARSGTRMVAICDVSTNIDQAFPSLRVDGRESAKHFLYKGIFKEYLEHALMHYPSEL